MQKTDVTQETEPSEFDAPGMVVAFGITDQLDALTCAGAVRP
jgi:hypothetical protein